MFTIFAAPEKTLASFSRAASSARTKPGLTVVSLFNKITYAVSLASMPRLTAVQKPEFFSSAIIRAPGNFSCTSCLLPSVEPLSTTITRAGSSARDARQFSI